MSPEIYILETSKIVRKRVKDKELRNNILNDLAGLLIKAMKEREQRKSDWTNKVFEDFLEA